MNALTEARDDLAARYKTALDGINVFTIKPERVAPPVGFLGPDDPYLTYEEDEALAYGEVLMNLRLVLVVEPGANDKKAADLDELLVRALAVDPRPFSVTSVGEPGRLVLNKQEHLGVAIHLSAPLQLED